MSFPWTKRSAATEVIFSRFLRPWRSIQLASGSLRPGSLLQPRCGLCCRSSDLRRAPVPARPARRPNSAKFASSSSWPSGADAHALLPPIPCRVDCSSISSARHASLRELLHRRKLGRPALLQQRQIVDIVLINPPACRSCGRCWSRSMSSRSCLICEATRRFTVARGITAHFTASPRGPRPCPGLRRDGRARCTNNARVPTRALILAASLFSS